MLLRTVLLISFLGFWCPHNCLFDYYICESPTDSFFFLINLSRFFCFVIILFTRPRLSVDLLRYWFAHFPCFIITLFTHTLSYVLLLRYWFAHFDLFHYYVTDARTFLLPYYITDTRTFIRSIFKLFSPALLSLPLLHYRFPHIYLLHYYVKDSRTFIGAIITLLIRALVSVPLLR